MQQLNLEKIPEPIEDTTDMKLLKRKQKLEKERGEIKNKLEEAKGDEAKILEEDLKNKENQIKQSADSFNLYRRKKKISSLKEIAGDKNVAKVLDFKKKKQEGEIILNEDEKNEVGDRFTASLEEFKKKKREAGSRN
ncbi:MAG: hypothetical protein ABH830_02570 [Patescibacteria group bacterium]